MGIRKQYNYFDRPLFQNSLSRFKITVIIIVTPNNTGRKNHGNNHESWQTHHQYFGANTRRSSCKNRSSENVQINSFRNTAVTASCVIFSQDKRNAHTAHTPIPIQKYEQATIRHVCIKNDAMHEMCSTSQYPHTNVVYSSSDFYHLCPPFSEFKTQKYEQQNICLSFSETNTHA